MQSKQQTHKSPEELVDEIKKLMSANVSKSIHLITRFNDLIKSTVDSASSQDPASTNASEILERWLNFNVATYTVISDHTLTLLDKLITVAEGTMTGTFPGKHQETEKKVDIRISCKQGKQCDGVFLIQNHFDRVLEVSFEATPLVAEGAAPLGSTHVTFEPSSTGLKPGEQRIIKAIVNTTEDFIAGKTYVTQIHVLGYESKELILAVDVLPPDPVKSQPEKQKSGSKTRKPTSKRSTQPQKDKKKPEPKTKRNPEK